MIHFPRVNISTSPGKCHKHSFVAERYKFTVCGRDEVEASNCEFRSASTQSDLGYSCSNEDWKFNCAPQWRIIWRSMTLFKFISIRTRTIWSCNLEQDYFTPVRRHVWRWTSERERDKSVFGMASMPGLSGFRDNETGHARANVVTPPPTLVNLVTIGSLATHQILAQLATGILRYGDGGARAHVQRYPPMTCGKHLGKDSKPTHQIWTQSAETFVGYRSAVCTCARAEIPHPWLLHKL